MQVYNVVVCQFMLLPSVILFVVLTYSLDIMRKLISRKL